MVYSAASPFTIAHFY
ncbi:hypothetical protein [Citrobacter sedlakii]